MLKQISILISALTLIFLTVFSSFSFAQNSEWTLAPQDEAVVNEFIQHLNLNFPFLKAEVKRMDSSTLNQLYLLESDLMKDFSSNALGRGELTSLSCTKPACGGGGSCKTCYINSN